MVWQLANNEDGTLGFPKRALRGHSHYVQVRRLPRTAATDHGSPALVTASHFGFGPQQRVPAPAALRCLLRPS